MNISTNVSNIATNASDIVATSGIANYASGQALSLTHASGLTATNASNISTNTTNIATNAADIVTASGALRTSINTNVTNISTNATDIVATSGIANYASGQAILNEADIVTTTAVANYASGEALSLNAASGQVYTNVTNIATNASDIIATSGIAAYASGQSATYTAGTGIVLTGTEISVGYIAEGNPGIILTEDVIRLGDNAGKDCGAANVNVAMVGDHAGAYAVANTGTTMLGPSAGWESVRNINSNYIGFQAGRQCIGGNHNNYIGYQAGMSSDGSNNLEIVNSGASTSVIGDNSGKVHIQKVIIGDSVDRKLAVGSVGASNLDPDATLEIIPAAATDVVLIARGAISQSADVTSWQTSNGGVVAGMTPSGVLNTYGVVASGAGLRLSQATPTVTTDTLYNAGGSLYFNGSEIGGGASAEATYASGEALSLTHASGLTVTNASDIVATSGIANYASGQAIANEADIVSTVAVANYASGEALSLNAASGQVATNTTNIATNATDIVATSGIANYASGLAITNESQVAYASGQAIENEGLVTYASGNTANIAFGDDDDEGDILYHNGASFTRLAKGANNYVLTMNGNVPNWEAAAAGGVSWDGSTANGVATFKNTNEATVESNLTFDGNTLTVATSSSSVSPTVVKAAASQTADLTSWETSAGGVVAAMTASGVLNTYGVVASGDVSITGDSELNLVGAYVNEAVPASNTPTASTSRTLTFDLSTGNYHNQSLPSNSSVGTVNKIIFANAKRGQRFIIRLTQHASSANTVSWGDVDANASNLEAIVRWAGDIEPTMSTTVSNTDVYGFLCTNDLGTKFDGFIIGQDLPA